MSVAEFHVDSTQVTPETGLKLDRGALLRSRPLQGVPCKFRTCYDVTFWPLSVAEAEWTTPDRLKPPIKSSEAVAAVRIALRCAGDLTFAKLSLPSLRFYLSGESSLIHSLYELLCNNCVQILVRDASPKSRVPPVYLTPEALRPVGFAEEEGMLPYPRRSFIGYGLLQEYFCFPQKFFFLDLSELDKVCAAGFGNAAEIILLISPFERSDRRQTLELGVSAKTFRLGCAPIVNLFPQTAEPILLSHRKYEYPVVPDVSRRSAMEIFEINEVVSANPQAAEVVKFEPFYSFRHGQTRAKIRRSGTPRGALPACATTRARRFFSRWWISRASRCSPMWTRSRCAPSAPTAICPRACRSAMRRAISNWKAPFPSSASWR